MTRWRSLLALLTFVVSWSVGFPSTNVRAASPDASQETTYLINWRPLEGEELRLYLDIKGAIQRVTPDESLDTLYNSTVGLAHRIETLPSVVADSTKHSLQRELSNHLHDTFEPRDTLVLKLLATKDATIQIVALDTLKPHATERELDTLPAASVDIQKRPLMYT